MEGSLGKWGAFAHGELAARFGSESGLPPGGDPAGFGLEPDFPLRGFPIEGG